MFKLWWDFCAHFIVKISNPAKSNSERIFENRSAFHEVTSKNILFLSHCGQWSIFLRQPVNIDISFYVQATFVLPMVGEVYSLSRRSLTACRSDWQPMREQHCVIWHFLMCHWSTVLMMSGVQVFMVFINFIQLFGWLEFNIPFQHKCGYIRDERIFHSFHCFLVLW